MPQFLWVFVFGSEPNSYLGQFGHSWSAMNNSVEHHPQQHHEKHPAYEMTGDKTMVGPATGTAPAPVVNAYNHPAASPPQSPDAPEYKERVQALHDCE